MPCSPLSTPPRTTHTYLTSHSCLWMPTLLHCLLQELSRSRSSHQSGHLAKCQGHSIAVCSCPARSCSPPLLSPCDFPPVTLYLHSWVQLSHPSMPSDLPFMEKSSQKSLNPELFNRTSFALCGAMATSGPHLVIFQMLYLVRGLFLAFS